MKIINLNQNYGRQFGFNFIASKELVVDSSDFVYLKTQSHSIGFRGFQFLISFCTEQENWCSRSSWLTVAEKGYGIMKQKEFPIVCKYMLRPYNFKFVELHSRIAVDWIATE